MAEVSLMAVPPERDVATCASCGAELVADQRYCLSCGQAVSPVRLAFLDVLNEDAPTSARGLLAPGTIEMAPVAYVPADQPGLGGWLRRNSGLLGLLAVLLLCLIAGLLVGHWVTQNNKTPVASTAPVKVEVLGSSALAPAATSTAPTAATHARTKAASASSRAKKEEEEEAKEAAEEVKAAKPPPAPVKVSSSKLQKLSSTSGKKHEEEINALGDTPIETGG